MEQASIHRGNQSINPAAVFSTCSVAFLFPVWAGRICFPISSIVAKSREYLCWFCAPGRWANCAAAALRPTNAGCGGGPWSADPDWCAFFIPDMFQPDRFAPKRWISEAHWSGDIKSSNKPVLTEPWKKNLDLTEKPQQTKGRTIMEFN